MEGAPSQYEKYFQVDQQVKVTLHLADNLSHDQQASIKAISGDELSLDFFGTGIPMQFTLVPGSRVALFSNETWALCRCEGVVLQQRSARELQLKMVGNVEVQQRRDYFRHEVHIPLIYSVPEQQELVMEKEWQRLRKQLAEQTPLLVPCENGYKAVKWEGNLELLPQRVNLSGGGIRYKLREELASGTMVLLQLFLPLAPSRVICAVATVLRSTEIVLSFDKYTYYTTAMKFTHLDGKDREAIIAYLFNEQRNSLLARMEKKAS